MIVFIKELEAGAHGCWATVRMLGGNVEWAAEWGVKTFSREKKRIHVCRYGLKPCKVAQERGHHIWEFLVHAPGVPPPSYVAKAKLRDWRKLYQAAVGPLNPRDSPDPGAGEAPDRVALLKDRLMRARGHRDGTPARPEKSASHCVEPPHQGR